MQPDGTSSSTRPADNPWWDGNHFLISASQAASVSRWRFELGAGEDLRIVLDERSPGGERSGELVIVAGAALLSRGVTLPEGAELDAVDGPGLILKLVLELLGRAISGGPAAVSARAAIDHDEVGGELALETFSAAASFPAPWRVQGEVRRTGESTLAFDLVFTHGRGTPAEAAIQLSGTWGKTRPAPALDDRMNLDGWRVFSLGPRSAGGVLDYGARPEAGQAATLGQLRKALAKPPA
jgi:hypothetical protein